VLPDINAKDGCVADERVLVLGGDDLKLLGEGAVTEPSPTGTLNSSGSLVKVLLELVHAAEILLDGALEGAVLQLSTARAGRSEVLPEQGVVDVAAAVEFDGRLDLDLLAHVLGLDSGGVGLLGGVQVRDVGVVVLAWKKKRLIAELETWCGWQPTVVKLHDLARDRGLKSL
jgi:hypothetical protein